MPDQETTEQQPDIIDQAIDYLNKDNPPEKSTKADYLTALENIPELSEADKAIVDESMSDYYERQAQEAEQKEFEQYAQEQVQERVWELEAEQDNRRQDDAYQDALSELSYEPRNAAWNLAQTAPDKLPDLIETWSEDDPEAARSWLGDYKNQLVQQQQQIQAQQQLEAIYAEDQRIADIYQQVTQQAQAINDATTAEYERIMQDPQYKNIAPRVAEIREGLMAHHLVNGGIPGPLEATAITRSAFETALNLKQAETDADFKVAIEKEIHKHNRNVWDGTKHDIGAYDEEAAKARHTAEAFRITELGQASEERDRQLAGMGEDVGRTFEHGLAHLHEQLEKEEEKNKSSDPDRWKRINKAQRDAMRWSSG
jgi:hypothetical protein